MVILGRSIRGQRCLAYPVSFVRSAYKGESDPPHHEARKGGSFLMGGFAAGAKLHCFPPTSPYA